MKLFKIVFIFLIFFNFLYSQTNRFHGYILDSDEKRPLPSAHVTLTPIPLIDFPLYSITNSKGYFEFNRIRAGKYIIEITYLGYEKYIDTINIPWGKTLIDTFFLKQSYISLPEITIKEKITPIEQKADTIEFNAGAFRASPNSTLEDLVLKFPGVEKEENTIKVQGEEIKKIFVDGRRFFSDDPNVALKTLPAEIVEKVQLFDKKSEQAELTGFEDDQTVKAFNVITRVDKRQGHFGKLVGGYGTEKHFDAGANINRFDVNKRISLIGMSNDINKTSFSVQDVTSFEQNPNFSRRRGSQRGFRQSNRAEGSIASISLPLNEGINNTNAGGINYSNKFFTKLDLNSSIFISSLKNINETKFDRYYLTEISGLDRYFETTSSNSNNGDNQISVAINFTPDTINIIRSEIFGRYTKNISHNYVYGINYLKDFVLLNSNTYNRKNNIENYNLNGELIYSHRYSKLGRSISIGISPNFNYQNSFYDIFSIFSNIENNNTFIDSLFQNSDYKNKNYFLSTNIVYTEPLCKNGILLIRFNPFLRYEFRERRSYTRSDLSQETNELDTINSNTFENQNLAIRTSIGYRIAKEKIRLELEIGYQNHLRKGSQKFPINSETKNYFNTILPSFSFRYQFAENKNLRIYFSSRANIPSITQLQNTIDYSDPLFLRMGNPNLRQAISNRFNLRFLSTNPDIGRFLALNVSANYIIDNIGNNVFFFNTDTVIFNDIQIKKGTQLSYPVNLGNALSINFSILNSFKIEKINSNLSLSVDEDFSSSPIIINGARNTSKRLTSRITIGLNSNKEFFDYKINYTPTFTYSTNNGNLKIQRTFYHNLFGNLNLTFLSKFTWRNNFTYYFNPNLSDNKSNLIYNLAFSYYFLSFNSGELRLEVFDLFNQRNSLRRVITDNYIEDRNTTMLERFFLLSFTYNFRSFK